MIVPGDQDLLKPLSLARHCHVTPRHYLEG